MTPGDEARSALVATGARAYMPMVGGEVYAGGGYDMVFDCVGSPSSLDQSLRSTAARGEIVLLGCAGQVPKLDLTFLWARELNLQGYVVYGREDFQGRSPHTFEITMERMLADGRQLSELVTHVFPLGAIPGRAKGRLQPPRKQGGEGRPQALRAGPARDGPEVGPRL